MLTSATYAPPEFQVSPEESKPLPCQSIKALRKVTRPPQKNYPFIIQLDDFVVGECNDGVKEQVKHLLNELRQIISLPGEKLGITSVMTHKIRLEDETPVY